ncbi:MAG: hypothetical protein AAF587_36690 [Bacteroidota bacterium]
MIDSSSQLSLFLQQFAVSVERGFLPVQDPASKLPTNYLPWIELAQDLHTSIQARQFRSAVLKLPLIDPVGLKQEDEKELALLVLSFLAHAYVGTEENRLSHIPASLAVPWTQLADAMGRLPIIQHSGMVLRNWRRLRVEGEMTLENLTTLFSFTDTKDEEAFFLITVLVEVAGAKAIATACKAYLAARQRNAEKVAQALGRLPSEIEGMTAVLSRMFDHCQPEVFYHQIRPYLASFEKVEFQGVDQDPIRNYHGGSAAQSTLFPVLDAVLGVRQTSPYLRLMRSYMPPLHAALVRRLEEEPALATFCKGIARIEQLRQASLDALINLRNLHLQIVAKYILGPAAKSGKDSQGTGGTNPSIFLKEIRDTTREAKNP